MLPRLRVAAPDAAPPDPDSATVVITFFGQLCFLERLLKRSLSASWMSESGDGDSRCGTQTGASGATGARAEGAAGKASLAVRFRLRPVTMASRGLSSEVGRTCTFFQSCGPYTAVKTCTQAAHTSL